MASNEPHGVLSLDLVKPKLEPLVPLLLDSFWAAWDWAQTWVASDDLARMILHSSTMAGIVSDAFGHFCRPRLVGEFRAQWQTSGRFQRAIIRQEIALRFKKLTLDLQSMNVRTEAQRKVYQQHQAILPNAQPITAITFGYTLDVVASKPTGVYFACPADFDRNWWVWPLYQAGNGQLSLFSGLPLPPDETIEDVLNVDIKIKRRKTENG